MFLLSLLWLIFFWLLAVATLMALNLAFSRLVEKLIPPIGRFIEIDGLRLHYLDSGERPGQGMPPLLFLHGWLAQLNHFTFALAALFPERRVVLLDRPGCGYSEAAPSQTLAAQAALVAKFVEALGLERPVIVGHSLGGAVAVALALDRGEKIAGLALIAPLTQYVAPPKPLDRAVHHGALARWFGAWTLAPFIALVQARENGRRAFAPEAAPPDFWRRAGGLLAVRPRALIVGARELQSQERELAAMAPRYAALAVPTGVLFGKGDLVLDPQRQSADFCANARNAELTLIDGGHMLPVTKPRAVEGFIRGVLARVA